jgi:hypothetical protein
MFLPNAVEYCRHLASTFCRLVISYQIHYGHYLRKKHSPLSPSFFFMELEVEHSPDSHDSPDPHEEPRVLE